MTRYTRAPSISLLDTEASRDPAICSIGAGSPRKRMAPGDADTAGSITTFVGWSLLLLVGVLMRVAVTNTGRVGSVDTGLALRNAAGERQAILSTVVGAIR